MTIDVGAPKYCVESTTMPWHVMCSLAYLFVRVM